MKIKYLHIKTKNDEEIKITDVSYITIGLRYDDYKKECLEVQCARGVMQYKLEEIIALNFLIANEKNNTGIAVHSLQVIDFLEGDELWKDIENVL